MVRDEIRVSCVQLEARDVERSQLALDEAVTAARTAAADAAIVVLPEATYPGYVLHDAASYLDPRWWARGVAAFADVAREGGAFVVVGLIRTVDGRLRNTAAVIGPDGTVVGVADKSFLWHFDSQWFVPGVPGEVLHLPFGDAGVFVCADARMMEIPRRLAIDGARLLCDTTALVVGPAGTNAQIEYMLGARAWENGAFVAVANKCGYEAGIAHYAGRSAIYGPDGERIADAPPDEPAIVTAVIDLSRATGPPAGRRPQAYAGLSRTTEPATGVPNGPPPATPLRVAMVQGPADEPRLRRELAADLVVTRGDAVAEGVLSVDDGRFRLGTATYAGGDVVDVAGARVGLLAGDRLSVPEEVRRLMLDGATVVVWDRPSEDATPPAVMQTRADENRVFVIVTSADLGWVVIAPTGAIQAARRPDDRLAAVLVELPLALAWAKEMAPGTDVVAHRRPQDYRALSRSG